MPNSFDRHHRARASSSVSSSAVRSSTRGSAALAGDPPRVREQSGGEDLGDVRRQEDERPNLERVRERKAGTIASTGTPMA